MAGTLRYLTVQDILWINFQVTRQVNSYQYATLEEATYYQYAYGGSEDLKAQAARFLGGFVKKAPFSSGNEVTAFVGLAVFLEMNGHALHVSPSDAKSWFDKAVTAAKSSIDAAAQPHDDHHVSSVRNIALGVIDRYAASLKALGGNPVDVIADGAIH